ncbi:MAG: DUF3782 domain-containing protein [Thermoproteus sp.]
MSVEEVKKVLLEHPEIIAEALEARPQILYQALAKLTPWQMLATKEDLAKTEKSLLDHINRLEDRIGKVEDRLEKEVRRLENMIAALGARWGVWSEEAFRTGLLEILEEAGWKVKKEYFYDAEGYVYGFPSEVEIDVVVRDGKTILVELTAAVRRGDLPIVLKKKEYYEKRTGAKVDSVYVITPFIHDKNPDKVVAIFKEAGVRIVYPTPEGE